MQLIVKKSWLINWAFILALFAISIGSLAQTGIGRETILKFDPYNSVLRPDAPDLTESVPMKKGRYNSSFLSEVGGVSFDQVAQPENNLKISSLQLNYDKNAADGSRLDLIINNKKVKVRLPDWILVPVAKYADSRFYSCVTLFGKLNDKDLAKQVTEVKGRVINYHPSFDNTLMGIRLAYMDMLVGYSFTSDLPRNSKGVYILGKGEVKPDIEANKNGAYYLSQHFIKTENKYMLTFRSYVISDLSRQIIFKLVQDSIDISGYPYYYCWKYNGDRNDYDINKVAKDISSRYNQKIRELSQSSGSMTPTNWLIDKMIALGGKYEDNFGFYSDGTFVDMVKLKTNTEKKQFLGKYAPESLFDIIVKTEAYMNRDSVIYLKNFSDDVSSQPDLFEAANPAVWNATVSTMRFAAFFRYIKTSFPEPWIAFLNQIKMVDPEPRIFTPTVMYNPDNKDLEQSILNRIKR
jgi:hypothetical protein